MGAYGSREHLPISSLKVDSAMCHLSDQSLNRKNGPYLVGIKVECCQEELGKAFRDKDITHYYGNH